MSLLLTQRKSHGALSMAGGQRVEAELGVQLLKDVLWLVVETYFWAAPLDEMLCKMLVSQFCPPALP